VHVATLEYAAKVLHDAIQLISNVKPTSLAEQGGDFPMSETDEMMVPFKPISSTGY
jgi:hypothetical protein